MLGRGIPPVIEERRPKLQRLIIIYEDGTYVEVTQKDLERLARGNCVNVLFTAFFMAHLSRIGETSKRQVTNKLIFDGKR
jgi:predicted transcriptional regulator